MRLTIVGVERVASYAPTLNNPHELRIRANDGLRGNEIIFMAPASNVEFYRVQDKIDVDISVALRPE